MPYFRFDASTPYCGQELTEYHEVDIDEVDVYCDTISNDIADMFWSGEWDEDEEVYTDGTYTDEDFYAECSCSATEITEEEFLEYGGRFKS